MYISNYLKISKDRIFGVASMELEKAYRLDDLSVCMLTLIIGILKNRIKKQRKRKYKAFGLQELLEFSASLVFKETENNDVTNALSSILSHGRISII